eukprot:CAMPEP_0203935328 /NCGR_PEP_ID=MMETSP0359-20131031/73100_1 /ASSEMBLY_ACC=CAM_ASM_000338 /TAXON_ID=268821 /ORGANISM="Scrippsiella Hangoei, Strain SHTV-5" /LENGTH=151 /DNA_ID=CAMNT_0050865161 /DNA_START=9 /DNA_END=460 /DNA_ORIENTATION=+
MAARIAALVACLALPVIGAGVTPIQKVLQLLQEMKQKGISEKEAESVRFSAFDQWCGDQKRVKTDEIIAGTERIEKLAAGIEKDAVHIAKLTDRIEEFEEDIARWAKDHKSTTDVRNKEAEDYRATSTDYGESLSALDEAIMVLKKKATKT